MATAPTPAQKPTVRAVDTRPEQSGHFRGIPLPVRTAHERQTKVRSRSHQKALTGECWKKCLPHFAQSTTVLRSRPPHLAFGKPLPDEAHRNRVGAPSALSRRPRLEEVERCDRPLRGSSRRRGTDRSVATRPPYGDGSACRPTRLAARSPLVWTRAHGPPARAAPAARQCGQGRSGASGGRTLARHGYERQRVPTG